MNGRMRIAIRFVTCAVFAVLRAQAWAGWPPTGQVSLQLRCFLDGPYNSLSGLMNDNLRLAGDVPAVEPYGALGMNQIPARGDTVAPGLLAVTGNNAIVDRSSSSYAAATMCSPGCARPMPCSSVMATWWTRNGNPHRGPDRGSGDYYVVIKHRNHLGVMSHDPLSLSAAPTILDLALPSTPTYGTGARKIVGGAALLWAGDVTGNGVVKYSGAGNDRDPILVRIGGTIPTNTVSGYYREDVNMDGIVRYTGANNDRDRILANIGGADPHQLTDGPAPAARLSCDGDRSER